MNTPVDENSLLRDWVDSPEGDRRLGVIRIMWAALFFGMACFLFVFLLIGPFHQKDGDPHWIFAGLAGFFSLASCASAQFFWTHMRNPAKRGVPPEQLVNQVLTQWVVVMAHFEGPCFLCLILFLLSPYNPEKGILLGMAIGLMLFLASKFPTRTKLFRAMGGVD